MHAVCAGYAMHSSLLLPLDSSGGGSSSSSSSSSNSIAYVSHIACPKVGVSSMPLVEQL